MVVVLVVFAILVVFVIYVEFVVLVVFVICVVMVVFVVLVLFVMVVLVVLVVFVMLVFVVLVVTVMLVVLVVFVVFIYLVFLCLERTLWRVLIFLQFCATSLIPRTNERALAPARCFLPVSRGRWPGRAPHKNEHERAAIILWAAGVFSSGADPEVSRGASGLSLPVLRCGRPGSRWFGAFLACPLVLSCSFCCLVCGNDGES